MISICLVHPQIPQNTGNVVRTCKCLGIDLYLIRPLGFATDSKSLKRAGLDYWDHVNVIILDSFEEAVAKHKHVMLLSSKANKTLFDATILPDTLLVFGSESNGLSEDIHKKYDHQMYRVPMKNNARCLNLASTVCCVAYEAARQLGTDQLQLV